MQKKKSKKPEQPTHRGMLSVEDKELMMSVLIRNLTAFEAVRDILTIDHFDDTERGFALVWKITLEYFEEWELMPSYVLLRAEIRSVLAGDPEFLNESEIEELEVWLEAAYAKDHWDEDIETSKTYAGYAVKTAKRQMTEHVASALQKEIKGQGRMVINVCDFLEEYQQQQQRIETVGADVDSRFAPDGWDKQGGINMFPTGVKVFDEILGGGQAAGEVYGLMGPFGSCKTTYSVMLATAACERAELMSEESEDEDYYSFLISFETPLENELRLRAFSCYAQILRKSLESMGKAGIKSLSTSANPTKLKDYEKSVPWNQARVKHGRKMVGEQERYDKAAVLFNKRLIAVDLTGKDKQRKGQGDGYIPEISRLIGLELRKKGARARASQIIVDYVGAMAKRHLIATGEDMANLRHYIGGAPLMARNMLADRFDCPVWLIHQLSGQSNKKGPGAFYDHTDAAESASFGENLDFSLVIGKPNTENLCQLVNSKHRRTGGTPVYVVQIEGAMNRVVWNKGEYVVDPYTRTIQTAATASSVVSFTPTNKKKTKNFAPPSEVNLITDL